MTTPIYNFSAGPAVLPASVLQTAAEQMADWQGSRMSVMEMSHRGPQFISIAEQAEARLRSLLRVPEDYRVLFMQGGGLAQNAIVPLNLLRGRSVIDVLLTGQWSLKSAQEAARYATVNIAGDGRVAGHLDGRADGRADGRFVTIPAQSSWKLSADAAYLHLCTNETVDGVEFQWTPRRGQSAGEIPPGVALVADMSSHILSREIDVSAYDCIFAGAQKNIGPAGLTIVIVRDELIGQAHRLCPSVFDYRTVAQADSMYNTPPTWAIYVAGLVFEWIEQQGGLAAIEQRNIAKAALLYDCIDASGLYENRVDPACRSRMNVPFFVKDSRLEAPFLAQAEEQGLLQLKGHRSMGGLRASIYNAMPEQGVRALVNFMRDFERRHG
jgi:phosphoserine aminotransferase